MNFTEQEVIEALDNKVKALNQKLSPQSLGLVKHLFKYAKEDETLDSFLNNIQDVFVGFAKQAPNELATMIKERELVNTKDVQALVEKGIEDYKVANPSTTPIEPIVEPNGEMKAILDRLTAIETENQTLKSERLVSGKRTEVISAFKSKGITDDEWINSTIAFASLNSDTDVDSYVESGMKLYNKAKSVVPRGNTPSTPSGSSHSDSKDFDDIKAEFNKQKELETKI